LDTVQQHVHVFERLFRPLSSFNGGVMNFRHVINSITTLITDIRT